MYTTRLLIKKTKHNIYNIDDITVRFSTVISLEITLSSTYHRKVRTNIENVKFSNIPPPLPQFSVINLF